MNEANPGPKGGPGSGTEQFGEEDVAPEDDEEDDEAD